MNEELMEAGKIANTHGIRGELKVQPWCDGADFLCEFDRLYLDGKPVEVLSARVHKGFALLTLEGVDTMEAAEALKNKVLYFNREDAELPEGRSFVADLIGLEVYDAPTDRVLGTLKEVLSYPAQDILVVKGQKEILIPWVDAFVRTVDPEAGRITVTLLEGMADDAAD